MMDIQLYPWQRECLKTWKSHSCKGIIQAVTGSGKTLLAINAIWQLKKQPGDSLRVKIVVPQTALAAQWSSALQSQGHISRKDIGFYYGDRKDSSETFCMIYVVNSARYALARHILQDLRAGIPVFLIADECHHYASPENRKIFDFVPFLKNYPVAFYAMGLSATPQTTGWEAYLTPALGNEIYRYTFDDAAQNQTISPFVICNIALKLSADEADKYDKLTESLLIATTKLMKKMPSLKRLEGAPYFRALRHIAADRDTPDIARLARSVMDLHFLRRKLVYLAQNRIDSVLELIARLDRSARIIIFSERIEQADEIYARINRRWPNQAGRYHSKMDRLINRQTLQNYRNGEIRILVTCRALDEGLDVPQTNVGIIMSSSSAKRQRIQRLGRILRKSDDGKMAALYYFYVENTTDAYTYMENFYDAPVKTLQLTYLSEDHLFIHPEYEEHAASLLSKMVLSDASAEKEMRRCLNEGLCRTDWLADENYLSKQVSKSATTHEKNYWLCMKMLHRKVFENFD